MKCKKILVLSLFSLFLIGCNGNSQKSGNDSVIPSYEENPDGYVDVLPSSTDEGNILHCFNWTFKQIEANLGAIKDAGFKSVQTSPVQQPKSNGASWWAFYQPLSFSIADNSPLGTKQDLKDLCDAAEEKGISVIVDIVFNHMANISDGVYESDGTPKVSPNVEAYEPEIYAARNDATNPTFHHNLSNGNNAEGETQNYPGGDLPDLNTSNALVQQRSYALLKECIDVGVDGFRFDAAKHIETSKDGEWSSSFWANTLGEAKTYYKGLTGHDLFAYGEILDSLAGTRDITGYTDIMDITDNGIGGSISGAVRSGNAERLAQVKYGKSSTSPSKLITWVESHDTYTTSSSHLSDKMMLKAWAVTGSREGSQSLFFARPTEDLQVGAIGSYLFENEKVATVNRFKNRFEGSDEEISFENDSTYILQRYNEQSQGALLVELSSNTDVSVSGLTKLESGIYYDQITGKAVTVHEGQATIEFDASGICALTKTKDSLRPIINATMRGVTFVDSYNFSFKVENTSTVSYQIDNNNPVVTENPTGSINVTLNSSCNLKIVASNANYSITREFKFTKVSLIPGYFNVVNIKPNIFTDYEVYLWGWGGRFGNGLWSKDYTVQDGVMLVDVNGITGFLIGLFAKGYTVTVTDVWDNNVLRQSGDIKGSTLTQGFYDASGL